MERAIASWPSGSGTNTGNYDLQINLARPFPETSLAPGGKTTHLAELSDDGAQIIASDVTDHRLDRIRENVNRLGTQSVSIQKIDEDGVLLKEAEPFDAVLVDVPCSNTGVLARRPEARWRFSESDLRELVELQERLLQRAVEKTRPGGRIVYSTCSIEPEETTEVVSKVCRQVPELTTESEQLLLPGAPSDGAYQALLRRS